MLVSLFLLQSLLLLSNSLFLLISCLLTFIEYYSIASSYTCVTKYKAKILPSVCMDGGNLTRPVDPFPHKALQQAILPLHRRGCQHAGMQLLYWPKVGIKLYKLPSHACPFIILLLVSLLFIIVINPYSLFKFKIFVLIMY